MPKNDEPIGLLFVDDEDSIRLTLAAVLQRHGFHVTTVATVADALTQINCCRYEVLVCDLNIEKAGDGFTVIGAMRYAQPHCVNLILTAYPSFENAMQALQHQVDEFFTKPADLASLVHSIRKKLEVRKSKLPVPFNSLAMVLRENCSNIVEAVRTSATTDPILASAPSPRRGQDKFSKIMDALIEHLHLGRNGLEPKALKLGAEHGRQRKAQGYDARMVAREFQLISECICELMDTDRMPAVPLGLIADLTKLTKGLNSLMSEALRSYPAGLRRSPVSAKGPRK